MECAAGGAFLHFLSGSFILYSFHYTGKLNSFDWVIYWATVALLLQPALLVHFALVFPERRGTLLAESLLGVYVLPAAAGPARLRRHRTLDFCRPSAAGSFWIRSNLLYLASIFCWRRGFSWRAISARPAGVAAAIEVGDRRERSPASCRSFCFTLCPYLFGAASAAVDESFGVFAGADSFVLRLRHYPLPADGRGHHFQARPGVHVCDGRRGGGVLAAIG